MVLYRYIYIHTHISSTELSEYIIKLCGFPYIIICGFTYASLSFVFILRKSGNVEKTSHGRDEWLGCMRVSFLGVVWRHILFGFFQYSLSLRPQMPDAQPRCHFYVTNKCIYVWIWSKNLLQEMESSDSSIKKCFLIDSNFITLCLIEITAFTLG